MVMNVGSNNRRICCTPRSLAKQTDSVARPRHPYLDATMTYLWTCLAGGSTVALRMLCKYTHKLRHCLLGVRQSDKAPTLWSDLGSWTRAAYKALHMPIKRLTSQFVRSLMPISLRNVVNAWAQYLGLPTRNLGLSTLLPYDITLVTSHTRLSTCFRVAAE